MNADVAKRTTSGKHNSIYSSGNYIMYQ